MLGLTIICANTVRPKRGSRWFTDNFVYAGCALLVYATFTFVYVYKTTGGATGVEIVSGPVGQRVQLEKGSEVQLAAIDGSGAKQVRRKLVACMMGFFRTDEVGCGLYTRV